MTSFTNDYEYTRLYIRENDIEYLDIIMIVLKLIVFIAYIESFQCFNLNTKCAIISDENRVDCHPEPFANEQKCFDRGCCWYSPENPSAGDISYCYFPPEYFGYRVERAEANEKATTFKLNKTRPSGLPDEIQLVHLEIFAIIDRLARVRFVDANKKRFEPDFPKLNIPKSDLKSPLYDIKVTNESRLIIRRKSNGKHVFNVDLKTLIFSNQFHQITSSLPSKYIYGLGEHKAKFRKDVNWKRYTFFNFDSFPNFNTPLYGSHPFYFAIEDFSTYASGVFLFNSNSMDILLSPAPAITFRPIGGVLDFFVFVNENASGVVSDYIKLIGLPVMPPLWAFGFHLCRWGYRDLNHMIEAWNRTRNAKLPFDVQWVDIEYMENFNDFTYDQNIFANLPEFIRELHKKGMHFVIILDPGISSGEPQNTHPPYEIGVEMDIFIKNASGGILVGKVWNKSGKTVFPDFTNPNATEYWTKQAQNLYKQLEYDGLWIDMNEASNFIDGSYEGCPSSPIEDPPYIPGHLKLRHKSICATAKTHAGLYYDTHNLYSTYQTFATYQALLETIPGKRPFILSRSTFPGQGKYGTHWTGDDTTSELCARWMAVGAFYPFSRNHNSLNAKDQDPASPNFGPEVVQASRYALNLRYKLIPYFYTLFYRAHAFGETVIRPLFFTFPHDNKAYEIENQFMWGSGLMILPVLKQGVSHVHAYLPSGIWYENTTKVYHSNGEYFNFDAPIDKINVLIRGGEIIPYADETLLTKDLHKVNFNLFVALDEHYMAKGELYWDDGESVDSLEKAEFNLAQFETANKTLKANIVKNGFNQPKRIYSVIICGVENQPSKAFFNSERIT
ncbi:lysosomal alpha-glucosidase-like protein, partial [Dinothrombium tinctorium]